MLISQICPVCRSKTIDKKLYHFVRCHNCGLFYQYPMPSEAWLNRVVQDYGEDVQGFEADETQKGTFQQRLTDLAKYIKPESKILDVGCGGGLFVRIAKEAGYDVEAMDKAIACVRAMGKIGVPAYNSLGEIPDESYDAITLFDVIEHVKDPTAFLTVLHKKLKKDGIIMITTPNVSGMIGYVRPWILTNPQEEYSEHTVLFDKKSLTYLLDKTFYTPLNMTTDTIMVWSYSKNVIIRKIINKIVYLSLYPFKGYLFAHAWGDNVQFIAKKVGNR